MCYLGCTLDKDCKTGALCAASHTDQLVSLGWDASKADCDFWDERPGHVCFDANLFRETKAPTTAPISAASSTQEMLQVCQLTDAVCDQCDQICTQSRYGPYVGSDGKTTCCVGDDACSYIGYDDLDHAISPHLPGGKVCCKGKNACGMTSIKAGKEGLCCGSNKACEYSFISQTPDVNAELDRLPVACNGLRACRAVEFDSNYDEFWVANNLYGTSFAAIDICCSDRRSCKYVSSLGSNVSSQAQCRGGASGENSIC